MSLLEKAAVEAPPATDPAAAPPAGETPPPANDWYYDQDIKGNGEKPEWFKGDKYKTITDQAKAYSEVEKKLGAFKGAPEKYDLSLADYPELKFQDDDPMLVEFLESAKQKGVSQEYVTEILGTYAKALTLHIPDADAEMKKIGPNAVQDLQILANWAGQYLSKDEFQVFERTITTADAFRMFDKLRQSITAPDVPPRREEAPRETEEQVLKLVQDPRYDTDSAFRDDVRKRLAMAQTGKGKK